MQQVQLQSRLKLLDTYIAALKSGNCDNPQFFLWEEGDSLYHEQPLSFSRFEILKRVRKAGVKVEETQDGFSISLLPSSNIG